MGIQSTITVTREHAITRIGEIDLLVSERNYRELEKVTFEPDYDLQEWVDRRMCSVHIGLEYYTNTMLECLLGVPFYRHSFFENYFVVEN